MSNRSRRDEDVFSMGRDVPSGTGPFLVNRLVGRLYGTAMRLSLGLTLKPESLTKLESLVLARVRDGFKRWHDSIFSLLVEEVKYALECEEKDLLEGVANSYDCQACGNPREGHYSFLLPCHPSEIDTGHPTPMCALYGNVLAYRDDDDEKLVIESSDDLLWSYCSLDPNVGKWSETWDTSVKYYVWTCFPLGSKDPVTEEYMRSIST